MRKTRTLQILAAILALEAAVIVALPSRMPRPARAIAAAVDAAAAAGLWLLARQRGKE
jgi:hypothetical protein